MPDTELFKINGQREQLETEFRWFTLQKRKWLPENKDKFALVKGIKLINFYETLEDAYEAGLRKFGEKPFLVKKVSEDMA